MAGTLPNGSPPKPVEISFNAKLKCVSLQKMIDHITRNPVFVMTLGFTKSALRTQFLKFFAIYFYFTDFKSTTGLFFQRLEDKPSFMEHTTYNFHRPYEKAFKSFWTVASPPPEFLFSFPFPFSAR